MSTRTSRGKDGYSGSERKNTKSSVESKRQRSETQGTPQCGIIIFLRRTNKQVHLVIVDEHSDRTRRGKRIMAISVYAESVRKKIYAASNNELLNSFPLKHFLKVVSCRKCSIEFAGQHYLLPNFLPGTSKIYINNKCSMKLKWARQAQFCSQRRIINEGGAQKTQDECFPNEKMRTKWIVMNRKWLNTEALYSPLLCRQMNEW